MLRTEVLGKSPRALGKAIPKAADCAFALLAAGARCAERHVQRRPMLGARMRLVSRRSLAFEIKQRIHVTVGHRLGGQRSNSALAAHFLPQIAAITSLRAR